MFKLLIAALLLSITSCCGEAPLPDPLDFEGRLKPAKMHSVLEKEDYFTWGTSPIKGDDGLYHVFYSRWPKSKGFLAWLTHSEIAHATSKSATGPYEFKEVVLTATDKDRWDGLSIHNPTIKKFGDKYYLYYSANTGDGVATITSFNWSHRNNQRIGVAEAESLDGPWRRFDTPLIDITHDDEDAHDALMVANPSVTEMKDGRYLMIYKAVAKRAKLPSGGPVCHLYAISDSPIGPFKKYNTPIFTSEESSFPAEDPYIWLQGDRYYAIVKDMKGSFTGKGRSLALFTSNDGFDWAPAPNPLVSTLEVEWESGEVEKYVHLERPQLLFENGRPAVLFLATDKIPSYKGVTEDGHSFNMHIELDF